MDKKLFVGLAVGLLMFAASNIAQADYLNLPPVADAGGPYSLLLGSPLLLNGSGSFDPNAPLDSIVSYEWDINNDHLFGDATGPTPTVSWATLSTYHFQIGQQYTIGLLVKDTEGLTDVGSTFMSVVSPQPVPLPPSGVLFAVGLFGLAGVRRFKK